MDAWKSPAHFYADDPRRTGPREVEFGGTWMSGDKEPPWRVVWLEEPLGRFSSYHAWRPRTWASSRTIDRPRPVPARDPWKVVDVKEVEPGRTDDFVWRVAEHPPHRWCDEGAVSSCQGLERPLALNQGLTLGRHDRRPLSIARSGD